METRELRYFVAVAEELHFGRAATRLGMAQPPLSRAIRTLERRLGVTLLERTSRSVVLTAAGAVLLREARIALDAVEAAERRTRRAAEPGLALVAKAGASTALLAAILTAYAARPGAVRVDVQLCAPGEQERVLRSGRADVGLVHRPFDTVVGLDVEDLVTEPQVLVVAADHVVAGRPAVSLAEVDGLGLPRWPGDPSLDGQDTAALLQLVALGRACAVLPDSARALVPDGLAVVPVPDAPLVTTAIAWPPHSRSLAVADLVRTAGEVVAARSAGQSAAGTIRMSRTAPPSSAARASA